MKRESGYWANLGEYPYMKGEEPWSIMLNLRQYMERLYEEYRNNDEYIERDGSIIHKSAIIDKAAKITDCFVGAGVCIYEGVSVRNSVVFDYSVIGHASEVARSIILKQCSIPRFDYVGGSFLGENVRLGGCVSFATRRHDDKDVWIEYNGSRINTNRHKFGSLIGDNTKIGYGVHLNPGTVVGNDCLFMPYVDFSGSVGEKSIIYNKTQVVIREKRNFLDITKLTE